MSLTFVCEALKSGYQSIFYVFPAQPNTMSGVMVWQLLKINLN